MKSWVIWLIVVLIIGLGVWWAYNSQFYKAMVPSEEAQTTGTQLSGETVMVSVSNSSSLGNVLVGPTGMTLYSKAGEMNASTCYEQCAVNWPPLQPSGTMVAGSGANGVLGTINRTDNIQQVTYNGMPLYYWSGDRAPGDATGNGIQGVWSVVKP